MDTRRQTSSSLARVLALILRDAVVAAASFWLALYLRFEGAPPGELIIRMLWLTPLILVLTAAVGSGLGLYRWISQYASIGEMVRLSQAVGIIALTLLAISRFANPPEHLIPLSVPLIGALVLLYALGSIRLFGRVKTHLTNGRKGTPDKERVLIVGAGNAGEMIARDMIRDLSGRFVPVAFVDDDPAKLGRRIHGIPVEGRISELADVIENKNADHVIIAMPSASSRLVRSLLEKTATTQAGVKILPSLAELMDARPTTADIRDVDVEDLIGRKPVKIDTGEVARSLTGRRVLITGAAGSVGSELARQVLRFNPKTLWLLDNNESESYYLEEELGRRNSRGGSHDIRLVVADIRDALRVRRIFAEARPEVVFHAAAYKHVPLMEQHPREAAITNVIGTRLLAEAAASQGVDRFVLISTDKAVDPISVMGASKRISEGIISSYGRETHTVFSSVRFGNVLGSRGSVVPLFKRQIAQGGPITVTDREATRYFMTLQEAGSLILQAAAVGRRGEILVLDMGEPVRILDLAERMRELYVQPGEQLPEIVFTGTRSGDKVREALWGSGESVTPSGRDRIFRVECGEIVPAGFMEELDLLADLASNQTDDSAIKDAILDLAAALGQKKTSAESIK